MHRSLQGHEFDSHKVPPPLPLCGSRYLMNEKWLHRQASLGTICAFKTSELLFLCPEKLSISGFHTRVDTTVSGFSIALGCGESVA